MTFTCEAGVKLLSQVRGKKINQPFEEVSLKTLPPLLYSSFVRRHTPREVSGSHTLTTHHFLEGASQAPRVIL